ncbi:MAG: twin-arginine translocation signal domain-containing protein, partial [Cytophagales bacterium]
MTNRRNFIKGSTLSGLGALTILPNISFASENNLKSVQISIENHKKGKVYQPLNQLKINTDILTNIEVSDGNGSVYARFLNIKTANFYIAGALGNQTISAVDKNGKVISKFNFKVDTSTFIEDETGTYKELNNVIHWSMIGRAPGMDGGGGLAMPILAEGKFYYFFVPWLRDHVHTLKGMKYYFPDIKSAMELFAKYQREDGMIADNVYYSSKELTM